MKREFTCIICPNGCEITVETAGEEIASCSGALCKRGEEYVKQELYDPRRNIATSVLVENGDALLVSVRLTSAISKARIFDVMNEIKKVRLAAPVMIGRVVIKNVLGLESDIIATRKVAVKS